MPEGMHMNRPTGYKGIVRFAPLLMVPVLLLLIVGCTDLEPGNPVLPDGFQESQVPDASVKAYVYLKSPEPISVPVERFVEDPQLRQQLPSEVTIGLWLVWVGPKPNSFGMGLLFQDSSALDAVVTKLEQVNSSWDYMSQGDWLYAFKGDTEWVQAIKSAIRDGRYVEIADAYPDEWALVQLLPETPPGQMVAAGFARLDEEFVTGITETSQGTGSDVKSLIDAVNVKSAAFGLYAEQVPTSLSTFSEDFLKNMGLSGLVVSKTSYPGFIISFMFGRAASGAGLEKTEIEGGDAQYKALQEDLHVFIKNFGSTFFVAGAADKASAQTLMESVVAEHD